MRGAQEDVAVMLTKAFAADGKKDGYPSFFPRGLLCLYLVQLF